MKQPATSTVHVLWILAMLPYSTGAYQPPDRSELPNIDVRQEPSVSGIASIQSYVPGSAAQVAAVEQASQQIPGLKMDLDPITGSPRMMRVGGGTLTTPAPRVAAVGSTGQTSAPPTAVSVGAPDAITNCCALTESFVDDYETLFGHGAEALRSAEIRRSYQTPHNGLTTVVWQQKVDGIDVFEAVFTAHATREGALLSLSSQFQPDPQAAAAAGTPNASARSVPGLDPREAVRRAADSLDVVLQVDEIKSSVTAPEGAVQQQRFKAPGFVGEIQVHLEWLPMNRDLSKLCWDVLLTSQSRGEMFRLLVDAQTGTVLVRRCLTEYLSSSDYRVFTGNSPSPFSPGHPVPSSVQPPLTNRSLLTISALDTNASPLGWISDGGNQTLGNNVDAHLDRDADDSPDLPRPQGAPFRVFDFPMDLTQAPSTYGDASVVQLFYSCNWMHDRLYQLGFTEAAGNFQTVNFGRGGLGNDAVQADAQDGSGTDNANMSTPPDGSPGRMQMYLFVGPSPDRDGDFDAEVVLHEYTHGLSNRRVGGGVGISALQSRGMGEGWSDFYSLALLSEPGDDVHGNYPHGGYVTYLISAGFTENYYYGIRRYPYSTDLTKNPLTFKDIDPAQISSHPGVPRSPRITFSPSEATVVHRQGEVWCVALWEARANLILKFGHAVGNELMLQLVTDGMALSPPNPNFLEARDAILQADFILTGGQNQRELWAAFAKRGMGFSATSPSSDTTDGVVEAFDIPDDLQVLPKYGFTAFGEAGGPFTPDSQVYALSNTGSNSIAWGAATTVAWLEVTPAGGTLAPGGPSTNVTVSLNSLVNTLALGSHSGMVTFTNLNSGVVQTRVVQVQVKSYASIPFVETFESGDLQSYWTVSGTGPFRSEVVTSNAPHGGAYHLVMDSSADGTYARNEVTLGINLEGYTNVVLTFWGKEFSDESDGPPPIPFILGADFDGVAISEDGTTWYEVQDLRTLTSTYASRVVNLDPFLALHGLSYNRTFRIRFNQYDNFSVTTDGIAIDDISITGMLALPGIAVALPVEATEGNGILVGQGSLALSRVPTNDVLVTLNSSDTNEVLVPPSLVIPAGQTNVHFDVTIVDDADLDGSQPATVTASASGHLSGTATLTVHDNESTTLLVALPPEVSEGDGAVGGEILAGLPPVADVVLKLTSSDPSEFQVPPFILLPAGQTSTVFVATIPDDNEIDGDQFATLTANVVNWIPGTHLISVHDNESTNLVVTLPAQATEGDGTLMGAATVQISGTLPTGLDVALDCDDSTELIVPALVTIAPGTTSASFSPTVADDPDVDGAQTVTVTASASGFLAGSSVMTIYDDESPPTPVYVSPANGATEVAALTELIWTYPGSGDLIQNGGFEEGDFSGWAQANSGAGSWVINDGSLVPPGPDGAMPPRSGAFSALSQQTGAGTHTLYQDVTVPHVTPQLEWAHLIRNHGASFGDSQYFRVEVRDLNDRVLAVPFATQPGDVLLGSWTNLTYDLSAFAGQMVRIAFVESDTLGYLNVHLDDVDVTGPPVGAPILSEVYVGTTPTLGPPHLVGTTSNTSWTLPQLAPLTTYYWQIIAQRVGTTPGPIWHFTTRGVDHFDWSNVNSPQPVGVPFPATLTARDEFGRLVTNFNDSVTLSAWGGGTPGSASDIVVTEIDTNPDIIEFMNASSTAVDMSGWRIAVYDSSWPEPRVVLTLPSGSVAPAGGLFQLDEGGTAPGAYPFFYTGVNIDWVTASTVSVLVIDDSDQIVDFMAAAEAAPISMISNPVAIPASEWLTAPVEAKSSEIVTYQRIGDSDNQGSNDWVIADENIGVINPGLTLPFGGGATQLPIYPTNSGSFVSGFWTGNITVLEPGTNVTLLAVDANDHRGRSVGFDVLLANDLSVTIADGPDPVAVGAYLTNTITIVNSGPTAATGVTATNYLPPALTHISTTASQGTCVLVGNEVRCDLGTLNGGTVASIIVVTVPAAEGVITNQVVVDRAESESYPANNAAESITTVLIPALSIADASLEEGDIGITYLSLEVQLTPPAPVPVQVHYATVDETAQAGSDYIATNGMLEFAPGETLSEVVVAILGDTELEDSETFTVMLSDPVGAILADALGRGTILDDEGTIVSLPYNLNDGEGYLWDIQQNGNISNGTSDAYDGGHVLFGFPNFSSGLLVGGREMVIGPSLQGGLEISRRIYVPASHAYARFLEVLHNPGATPVTTTVRLDTNLGSDSSTVVVGTSSGDTVFQTNDNWIVTDDSDGSGDPTILHVIANDAGTIRPSSVAYSTGSLNYQYSVTVPPGETRMVMHFGAQNPNRAIALAKAPELTALGQDAFAHIAPGDVTRILNFGPPDALVVSPVEGLVSSGYEGGPFSPSNKVYSLLNAGTTNLNWTAHCDQIWVSVLPSAGTLAPGNTMNLNLFLNTNASTLTTGLYVTPVIISNQLSGAFQTREVNLTVDLPPQPPPIPFGPLPPHLATGVSTHTRLSWNNALAQLDPHSRYGVIDTAGYDAEALTHIQGLTGLTAASVPWSEISTSSGATLLSKYDVIYFAVDARAADYQSLRTAVTAGNSLEEFVSLGGTLVLNVAGNNGNQADVGPGGLDYDRGSTHEVEVLVDPAHPYVTGVGFGGTALTVSMFDNWNSTDHGRLIGMPGGTTEILRNTLGTSMIEYRWGAGRVVASTLTFGWPAATIRSGPPFDNELLYAASGTGADSYEVYLGLQPTALSLVATNLRETTFDPGMLAFDTTYYWQIVASNAGGTVLGPIWQFATAMDEVRFASVTNSISEGAFQASITIVRENPAVGPLSIEYATTNGTATAGADYIDISGTLSIPVGVLSTNFPVTILEDNAIEDNETVLLQLRLPAQPNVLLAVPSNAVLTIVDNDGPPDFQIAALSTSNSHVVDHNTLTGDDRGGVALSASQAFVTGDNATARFSAADLSGGIGLGSRRDSLCTDLQSETVYLLGNGNIPLTSVGGTLTSLIELDGATGQPTGVLVPLSQSFTMPGSGNGIFSGYGRVVIHNGSHVYDILLPSGMVIDRGMMPRPGWLNSESWSIWGVAEYYGGELYLAYRESGAHRIVRSRVSDGRLAVIASFLNLSDMASFVVSPSRNRWYFHHEGSSQFGGTSETLGYADAQFLRNLPPIAEAGPDQTNECTGGSTLVQLDGRASNDPDGDPLTYVWRLGTMMLGTNVLEFVSLPLGTHDITLTATDPTGASDTDGMQVTVMDGVPPALICSTNRSVEFEDRQGAVVLYHIGVTDACSEVALTVTPPSASVFPIGITSVQAVAADSSGNQSSCSFDVIVLGARGVFENVLVELQVLQTGCEDAAAEVDLNEAIVEMLHTVNPALWTDQTHIEWNEGDQVFHGAKKAVRALERLGQHVPGCAREPELSDKVQRLVKSCRLLAVVSIEEAEVAGVFRNKIEEDLKQLEKGDRFNEGGGSEQAIESYRHAWKHSAHMSIKTITALPEGGIQIEFYGLPGASYAIEASTDLFDWELVGIAETDPDGIVRLVDPTAQQHSQRFYRVIQP